MNNEPNECSILVVDDDPGDRLLIDKAMKESGVKNRVEFLQDGQEMIDHLMERVNPSGHEGERRLPDLILLDLNMPRLDGHEALKLVKRHSALKEIPVLIFTNSRSMEDILDSYKEGANTFLTKPFDYPGLVRLMGLLKAYWLDNAKLPCAR